MHDARYNPPHSTFNKGGNKKGYPESLKIKAPAKINLGLKVNGLRPDGYHEIETTMQMVGLFDELSFERIDKGIEILVQGEDITSGEENMVYKAFRLLSKYARKRGMHRMMHTMGAKIRLIKNIPLSAGLGGGSSDGAATLIGLNRLWGLGIDREGLMQLSFRLGSDVPFFLFGPSAMARGRGEILTPVKPLNAWVLLINPNIPVSTSWVYKNYDRIIARQGCPVHHGRYDFLTLPDIASSKSKLLTKRKDSIKLPRPKKNMNRYINDLERVTLSKYPVVDQIKRELIDSGARISLMSGSGPTVFGIFSEKRSAEEASKRFKGYKVFIVKTLTESPMDKFLRS